uniref:Leucine rich repeats and guanylate kinase domain containing n=1 Tax=Lepisosteus oculatus TaxID=7918 RepID=W5NF30_LEPOC|nr:PREDICTED: leucine-rich repeat and guanylate kinase domain-containing protein isoform X1 [Lepisosteus oculatus]
MQVSAANSIVGLGSPCLSPVSPSGTAIAMGPLVMQEKVDTVLRSDTPEVLESPRSLREPPEYSSSGEEEPAMKEEVAQLTEEDVSSGLSSLGNSASGLEHVYLHLSLPGRNLRDISILCNYVHLQKLELSHNKIQDLSCVSYMPYLIKLDASHNELEEYFGFEPPKNLTEVDFSYNRMSEMKDLSVYSSLSKLILDYNEFVEIKGLEQCSSLTHLSLGSNRISHIDGLDNLPIKELWLRGNQIQKIENLENLQNLQALDLSFNKIQSLCGLQNHDLLETINLESNQISEIDEVRHIHDLPLLRDLNLLRNPIQEQPDYRLSVLFLLQRLTHLDQERVKAEEKVAAVNKYDPPPEVIAARDHMTHVVYQIMQPQLIYDSTLPSLDAPYPMLVLTGPQACGKRELAHKLCREFSDFFAYGACHTTRSPYFGEVDGADYHFVSDEIFENMICMGKFIQTMKYGGHYYGLAREAIESAAREGLACCVHMELEGVRSLKNTYFEPRYILLIPLDKKEYARRLRMRGLYSRSQIEIAVSRIDTYIKMNRDYPGYFDTVIPCDDHVEAYVSLSQSVREYLGLENQTTTENAKAAVEDAYSDWPHESPVQENMRDSPCGVTVSNYAHSTGANELVDPASRNYSVKVQAKLSAQKSPAEEASIRRRQQAVREALQRKSPSTYTQLFTRCPLTAPASLGPQQHLVDPASCSSMVPSASNITQNRSLSAGSLASSSEESRASSGLSMLSSAGAFSLEETLVPSKGLSAEKELLVEPLDISRLGSDLECLKDQINSGYTPDTPRPGSSGELTNVQSVHPKSPSPGVPLLLARPGSNTKPVLPPIPSGRRSSEAQTPTG